MVESPDSEAQATDAPLNDPAMEAAEVPPTDAGPGEGSEGQRRVQDSAEFEREGAAPAPSPVPVRLLETSTRWTLVFLVVVTGVCVVAWGSAKATCNHHPAHSERFNPAPLERRTTRPKDTALEFHHRLFVQDYETARQLAEGGGLEIVEMASSGCDPSCQSERGAREAAAQTRAILYRARGRVAWVGVETFFRDEIASETYELRRTATKWVVVGTSAPPPMESVPQMLRPPQEPVEASASPSTSATSAPLSTVQAPAVPPSR
jgi:hypothetical protein